VSAGPLDGLRVLDLGTVYAAPIAAMLLGDFGADVIKVEHPSGDPARTHGYTKDGHGLWWKVISRNKRTVTLNLSHPRGQELLLGLVEHGDVLIENFRPGVLERWNLGPDALWERNPGLVILRVTGFGQTGPYSQRRAFGTLAEAMSGFAHMTGEPDGPPTLPPFGLADGVAALASAAAVLMALYHRDVRQGRGQVIDVSLLEPLLTLLGPQPSAFDQLGVVPERTGNRSPNNAPRNAYRTRDGRWVVVSASAASVARRVMRLVGRAGVTEEPWFDAAGERVKRAEEIDAAVASWIAARDYAAVQEAFENAGAALAPVYDIRDLMADPQVAALRMITDVDDPDLGPLKMQNVMFRMQSTPGRVRFPGRGLGHDTSDVYRELLGIGGAELQQLRAEGVL
jgi:crotonobetainyl-CoA:carnitine CoA-transferase CaiB-like acyl-CoA transferase